MSEAVRKQAFICSFLCCFTNAEQHISSFVCNKCAYIIYLILSYLQEAYNTQNQTQRLCGTVPLVLECQCQSSNLLPLAINNVKPGVNFNILLINGFYQPILTTAWNCKNIDRILARQMLALSHIDIEAL